MSWLWIYITLMEWVATVMVIRALNNKPGTSFCLVKAMVYLFVYCIYLFCCYYFQLPSLLSIASYLLLFCYICWTCSDLFTRNFLRLFLAVVCISVIELLFTQILSGLYPLELKPGILEVMAVTLMVIFCFFLKKLKLYKVMDFFDRWEPAYALVAVLSLMIFSPMVMLKFIKKLEVTEYVYITACVIAMWLLLSRIQKYRIENHVRKKYLDSFSDIIVQIRRRQHKVKNQFNTAFGMYRLYDTYDELVEKQKEYLGHLWEYELPTDVLILEEPVVAALLYEKINEAYEDGIEVRTVFSCSIRESRVNDVVWVQILGTLLDNAIEALREYDGTKILWVEIERKKMYEERISVCVANTCRKLKHSEMEKIFEFGYSTKGEGRGIGLYDVKQLVDANRGVLMADNTKREEKESFEIRILI